MIKIIVLIILSLIFTKLMLFWLWLWQLKEYHWGRMRAHFETQKIRKLISSLTRFKRPRFTKKTVAIIVYGLLLEIAVLLRLYLTPAPLFYIFAFFIFISAPLVFSLLVLLFQIPTVVLQKRLLKKAELKREKVKDLTVIGITGSYGKTSTKEFLATILAEKFNILKTAKHINSEIGIAQTILLELKPEHQIFIAEIGAYEQGKIRQVCWMLQPKIGILTGINEQHLSTFGSQENIVKAKFELIESLPQDGVAVLNGDSKNILNLKSEILNLRLKSKIFCSIKEKMDVWAENIAAEKEGISFRIFSRDGDRADFQVNLIGRQNVENILLAGACAKELGMSLGEIAAACQKIRPEQGSVQLKKGAGGLNIIDATYSANPDGVLADLEYLKLWPGRKILIMPCLIELGKAAREVHQRIGESIGRICDLAVITTKDYFREIKKAAIAAGLPSENILLLEKPKQILERIKTFFQKDDIILLESRVPAELTQSLYSKSGDE